MPNSAIRVLIVDDSASARAMLRRMVEADAAFHVTAAVPDAFEAVKIMRSELPDVILLDLELPGMDGITFLRRIMAQKPIPVVICSSSTTEGSDASIAALEAGAIDVVKKPVVANEQARAEAGARICDALHAAAHSNRARARNMASARPLAAGSKLSPDVILPPPDARRVAPVTEPIVVIGASTGGTEALRELLTALPADAPAIAIVQHMPQGFTAAFARRMDALCALSVSEAADGDALRAGHVLIAQGDRHLLVRRLQQNYRVQVLDGPNVSRHRPSVDVLFRSTAGAAGANALGIILTGMGDDGAKCMAEMRACGAQTLAQDEASSVVWGMPGEAMRHGGAMQAVPLNRMAALIMDFARRHRAGVRA